MLNVLGTHKHKCFVGKSHSSKSVVCFSHLTNQLTLLSFQRKAPLRSAATSSSKATKSVTQVLMVTTVVRRPAS